MYHTTPMWLFRRNIDLSRATARPITNTDLNAASRLLRGGGKRFYGLTGSELPLLVAAGLGAIVALDHEILAVAIASWPAERKAWLRAVALGEGIDVRSGLSLAIPTLHQTLTTHGVTTMYYGNDDTVASWLDPMLQELGYQFNTDVVAYEKRDLLIPALGNRSASVRAAKRSDLDAVLDLDQRCFEPQWTKDDAILGPAIDQGPFFVVLEWEGTVRGYAYATSHYNGRLIHLVRIAVDPELQGRSLGVRLLAEVIEFARLHGADVVTLNTQAYNTHAQNLYRWFGFHPSGERQKILSAAINGQS